MRFERLAHRLQTILTNASHICLAFILQFFRFEENYRNYQFLRRRSMWKLVTMIDLVISISLLIFAGIVFLLSWNEKPLYPLKIVMGGYCLQLILHSKYAYMGCDREQRHRIPANRASKFVHEFNQFMKIQGLQFGIMYTRLEWIYARPERGSIVKRFALVFFGLEASMAAIALAVWIILAVVLGGSLVFIYGRAYAAGELKGRIIQYEIESRNSRRLRRASRVPPCTFCHCKVPELTFPVLEALN